MWCDMKETKDEHMNEVKNWTIQSNKKKKWIFHWIFNFSLCAANSEPVSSSVTADTVKNYLGEHPEFLDTYIQQNVNPNTIEQWISKRPQTPTQIQSPRRTSATIHPILPPPAPTPPPRPTSSSSSTSTSTKNNLSTSKSKTPLSATTGKNRSINWGKFIIISLNVYLWFMIVFVRSTMKILFLVFFFSALTTISSSDISSQKISSTTANSAAKVISPNDWNWFLFFFSDWLF